ncbi:MAG: phosphotransferase [Syntrophaceae bacterium]|nr:phosphotransferase [Syntrophaceae bacterium]
MNAENLNEYSTGLGIDLESLELIQENKYCLIHLAKTRDKRCIIKKYRGQDPAMMMMEAKALSFYHELTRGDPELMDSGNPIVNPEKNLLCIGFVEGRPLSDTLYSARRNRNLQDKAHRYMRILGRLMRTIFEKTEQPEKNTEPLIFEYFDFTSKRLEENSLLGPIFFKGYQKSGAELVAKFVKAKISPSFVHGDFVFRNIHVSENRVGLIDFANSLYLSHPLNDIYNMRIALDNMLIPKYFKNDLLNNFSDGFQPIEFPEIAHQFYYEYQRRRWLMLKLCRSNVEEQRMSLHDLKDWIQGLRGLATFAKPYDSTVKFP